MTYLSDREMLERTAEDLKNVIDCMTVIYGDTTGPRSRAIDAYLAIQAHIAQPVEERLTIADYEKVLADHLRLVRELDVALNGDGAAKQASLCDIISQVKDKRWRLASNQPVEVTDAMVDAACDAYNIGDYSCSVTGMKDALTAAMKAGM